MHHVRNKASIVFGTAPKTRISSQIPVSETKNDETPPSQCWWSSHVCWLMITLEWTSLWKGGHFTLEFAQKVLESWTSPSSLAQITCSGETSSSSSGLAQIHSAEWRIPAYLVMKKLQHFFLPQKLWWPLPPCVEIGGVQWVQWSSEASVSVGRFSSYFLKNYGYLYLPLLKLAEVHKSEL